MPADWRTPGASRVRSVQFRRERRAVQREPHPDPEFRASVRSRSCARSATTTRPPTSRAAASATSCSGSPRPITTSRPTRRPTRSRRSSRTSLVGAAFGVVLVHQGKGKAGKGLTTEVATFRTDIGYGDKRRPDRVEFTDAEHDAQAPRLHDQRALPRSAGDGIGRREPGAREGHRLRGRPA